MMILAKGSRRILFELTLSKEGFERPEDWVGDGETVGMVVFPLFGREVWCPRGRGSFRLGSELRASPPGPPGN